MLPRHRYPDPAKFKPISDRREDCQKAHRLRTQGSTVNVGDIQRSAQEGVVDPDTVQPSDAFSGDVSGAVVTEGFAVTGCDQQHRRGNPTGSGKPIRRPGSDGDDQSFHQDHAGAFSRIPRQAFQPYAGTDRGFDHQAGVCLDRAGTRVEQNAGYDRNAGHLNPERQMPFCWTRFTPRRTRRRPRRPCASSPPCLQTTKHLSNR